MDTLPDSSRPDQFGAGVPLHGRLLGFVVAAALLDLPAGTRLITLDLQVTPASFASVQHQLEPAVGQQLLGAFQARATGPVGWLPLEARQPVRLNQAGHTISWTFQLDHSQPAVAAYDPALHGGQLPTAAPAFQLVGHPRALPLAGAFFAVLEPVAWRLHVEVAQLEGLEFSNKIGPLDIRNPVFPFGAIAQTGDYLEMVVHERVLPRAESPALTLALLWRNLPANGFATYYEGYGVPFPSNGFLVNLWGSWSDTAENWLSLSDHPQRLFPAAASDELPGSATELRLKWPREWSMRDSPSTSLRVKIELTAPAQGFGASLYPAALANALAYNAGHAASPRQLPRAPFAPLLEVVTVSYAAEEFGDVAWELPLNQPTGLFRLVSPAGPEPVLTNPKNE